MALIPLRQNEHQPAVLDFWTSLKKRANQGEEPEVEGPNGSTFTVEPHSPSDNRSILLTSNDLHGFRITAGGYGDTPFIAFYFGAEACWNAEVEELVNWCRAFLNKWALEPSETLVSRLDLHTDVDEGFWRSDADRFGGRFGGGLSLNLSAHSKLQTLAYRRTAERDLIFRVYDKRAEQSGNGRSFWPEVWKAYGVQQDTPIWRVEYEAKRGRLKERGIRTWSDLTPERMGAFWTYCTSEFAHMDRQVWDRVQSASNDPATDRQPVQSVYEPDHIQSQIKGLVNRLVEEGDMSPEAADQLFRILNNGELSEAATEKVRKFIEDSGIDTDVLPDNDDDNGNTSWDGDKPPFLP